MGEGACPPQGPLVGGGGGRGDPRAVPRRGGLSRSLPHGAGRAVIYTSSKRGTLSAGVA